MSTSGVPATALRDRHRSSSPEANLLGMHAEFFVGYLTGLTFLAAGTAVIRAITRRSLARANRREVIAEWDGNHQIFAETTKEATLARYDLRDKFILAGAREVDRMRLSQAPEKLVPKNWGRKPRRKNAKEFMERLALANAAPVMVTPDHEPLVVHCGASWVFPWEGCRCFACTMARLQGRPEHRVTARDYQV